LGAGFPPPVFPENWQLPRIALNVAAAYPSEEITLRTERPLSDYPADR
jgi:hypothetical protein